MVVTCWFVGCEDCQREASESLCFCVCVCGEGRTSCIVSDGGWVVWLVVLQFIFHDYMCVCVLKEWWEMVLPRLIIIYPGFTVVFVVGVVVRRWVVVVVY